jgi:hypothetical protein
MYSGIRVSKLGRFDVRVSARFSNMVRVSVSVNVSVNIRVSILVRFIVRVSARVSNVVRISVSVI